VLTAALLLALLPLAGALVLYAARDPVGRLLPVYAASVPFGNGLAVPGLPPSYFSASSLTGFLLASLVLVRLAARRASHETFPASVVAWLLFVALAGSSIYWTLDVVETTENFIVLCSVVAVYVLIRVVGMDAVAFRRLELGIVAGGTAAAVYGIYQYYAGGLVVGTTGDVRFGRDLTDPNHVAASLLLPLAVAIFRGNASRTALTRVAYGVAAVSVLFAILLTGSRGGVLGAVVVFVVLTLSGPHRARTAKAAAATVAIVGLVALAVPQVINDRLTAEGTSGRTGIWKVGLSSCPEHCLTGAGWGTFGVVYEAYLPGTPEAKNLRGRQMGSHNNLLRALVEMGVVGFALVSAGLLLVVREAVQLPRAVRGPPLAAISALLVAGMLLGNISFKYFWLVPLYVGAAHSVHVIHSQRRGRARSDGHSLPQRTPV
jgi:O-antigen ligase